MGETGQQSGAGGSPGARTSTAARNETVRIGGNRSATVSQNETTTIGGGPGANGGGGEKGQAGGTSAGDLRQLYESQVRELYESLADTLAHYETQLVAAYQSALDQIRRDPLGVAPTPQLPSPQQLPVPPAFSANAAPSGEKGQGAATAADPSTGSGTDTSQDTPADPSGG